MSDLYDEPSCVDEPNMVECEHCGEMFDKIDINGEDICPECEGKSRECEECGERVFLDDPHYTSIHGQVFCDLECWGEHLKELNGGAE